MIAICLYRNLVKNFIVFGLSEVLKIKIEENERGLLT